MNGSPKHTLLQLTVATVLAASTAAVAQTTTLKTENFDREPAWDGHNNRVKVEKPNPVVQDFGYSSTHHAGSLAPGEMGGLIQRSSTSAFYGIRLGPPKTLESKLRCAGSFAVTQCEGTSCVYFGWFNSKTPGARPYNWMGLCLNGGRIGCEVHVGHRTGLGIGGGPGRITGDGPNRRPGVRDFNRIPNGTPYTFEFLYDPAGAGGAGEITFTLGGAGPFTGGPFKYRMPPENRAAGATFDSFGMINGQAAGGRLAAWFDDMTIDGQSESFDRDPQWSGQGNRAKFDDYNLVGAHRFGFSDTAFAGGRRGEIGGLMYSAPEKPGYYADKIGRLTLDHRLTASGKVAVRQYGPDSGMYVGWFDSARRGWPPANILGVLIDGPGSNPRFRACAASADPKVALPYRRETTAPIPPDGQSHLWKIEYHPESDGGQGRLTVWFDDHQDSFALPPGLRKAGAAFDRFGLFVHEGGGQASLIYLDDLTYTAAAK